MGTHIGAACSWAIALQIIIHHGGERNRWDSNVAKTARSDLRSLA